MNILREYYSNTSAFAIKRLLVLKNKVDGENVVIEAGVEDVRIPRKMLSQITYIIADYNRMIVSAYDIKDNLLLSTNLISLDKVILPIMLINTKEENNYDKII